MFAFWEHNGGLTISKTNMISMIEKLKMEIAKSCEHQADLESKRCRMREKIQYGTGLSQEDVFEFFEQDLLINYPSKSKKRREQVAYYLRNMRNSNRVTFRYEEDSQSSNEMLSYYQEAVRFKKDSIQLSRESAIDFQNWVSETCIEDIFLD